MSQELSENLTRKTMMGNNPKPDLVNVEAHTKFGQILSILSHNIERKQNSDNQSLAVTSTMIVSDNT